MNSSKKFSMNKWREFIVEGFQKGSKSVVKVKDLTFDMVKDAFPNDYQTVRYTRPQPDGEEGPVYKDYVNFPKGDGSLQGITDSKALEQWKSYILSIKGIDPNVEVTLDPNSDSWYDKATISDPTFVNREKKMAQAISAYYDSKKSGDYTGD